MTTQGGSVVPVRVIDNSELKENGGYLKIVGKKVVRVERITDLTGRQVLGGSTIPIYIVEESALTDDMSIEGGKVIPVIYSTDLSETRQSLGQNPLMALVVGGIIPPPPITVTYLFLDCFTTPESAPLTTPRVDQPTGTSIIVDTGNQLSISGGSLIMTVGTASNNPKLYVDAPFTRLSGRTLYMTPQLGSAQFKFGWGTNATGTAIYHGFVIQGGTVYRFLLSSTSVYVDIGTFDGTPHHFVMANKGCLLFVDNKLRFVDLGIINQTPNQTLYASMTARTGGIGSFDFTQMAIADLPAFLTIAGDTAVPGEGSGTGQIDSPSPSDDFIHSADFKMKFTVDVLPVAPTGSIDFRRQDATHEWVFQWDSSGTIYLYERDGSPVLRGQANTVLSAGSIVELVAIDEDIEIFVDGVSEITYGSAVNFKTETTGEIVNFSGTISDFVCTNAGSSNFASGLDHEYYPATLIDQDFTHPADFVGQFKLFSYDGTTRENLCFRATSLDPADVDANNFPDDCWVVYARVGGSEFQLRERVAGGSVTRVTTTPVVNDDDVVTLICDGNDIYVYLNNNLQLSYTSALYNTNILGTTSSGGATPHQYIGRELSVRQHHPSSDVLADLQAITTGCS